MTHHRTRETVEIDHSEPGHGEPGQGGYWCDSCYRMQLAEEEKAKRLAKIQEAREQELMDEFVEQWQKDNPNGIE